MANGNDIFAAPTEDELAFFSPPTEQELGAGAPKPKSITEKILAHPAAQEMLKRMGADDPGRDTLGILGKAALGTAQTGLQALDIPGGLARVTAAQSPMGQLARGEITSPEEKLQDYLRAFKGEAPTTGEYMERAGVPEGPKVSPFGMDISARDVAGFAGDVAQDPLGTVTKAVKSIPYLGKLLRGAAQPVEKFGKEGVIGYQSAHNLKAADDVAEQMGKKYVPSEIMYQEGMAGSAKSMEKQAGEKVSQWGAQRKVLLKEADDAGAVVSQSDMLAPVMKKINLWRKSVDPVEREAARKGIKLVQKYRKTIPKSRRINLKPSEVTAMKTNVWDMAGTQAFDTLRKTSKGREILIDLGRGLKEGTEKAVEKSTGKGGVLIDLNEKMGALLTAEGPLHRRALAEGRKEFITKVDMLTMGYAPYITAFGKGGDVIKSSKFKTWLGKLTRPKVGGAGVDPAIRRILINLGKDKGEQ